MNCKEQSCTICNQKLSAQCEIQALPCQHIFHHSCLLQSMLRHEYACPRCPNVWFPGLQKRKAVEKKKICVPQELDRMENLFISSVPLQGRLQVENKKSENKHHPNQLEKINTTMLSNQGAEESSRISSGELNENRFLTELSIPELSTRLENAADRRRKHQIERRKKNRIPQSRASTAPSQHDNALEELSIGFHSLNVAPPPHRTTRRKTARNLKQNQEQQPSVSFCIEPQTPRRPASMGDGRCEKDPSVEQPFSSKRGKREVDNDRTTGNQESTEELSLCIGNTTMDVLPNIKRVRKKGNMGRMQKNNRTMASIKTTTSESFPSLTTVQIS